MAKHRLKRLTTGKNRGNNIMPLFKEHITQLDSKKILDVGCGQGSLTLDFAKEYQKVHAIDASKNEVQITTKRVKGKKLTNVTVAQDNALNLQTTKEKYDAVHLSGVFEWLRAGNTKKTPKQVQQGFLKSIKKHMNKEGILYSGTENKLFPYYWIKDPHNDGFPLMVLLPYWLSETIFNLFGKKYIAKIYSYWTLKKMFKREFKQVDFYVPIPTYHYVYGYGHVNNPKQIVAECKRVLKEKKLDKLQRATTKTIMMTAKLGLIKLFSPGFITVAKGKK